MTTDRPAPICAECCARAVVVDEPPQGMRTISDPWCTKHAPRRPRDGWTRIKLTDNRTEHRTRRDANG